MTPAALRSELLKPWRHGEHFEGASLCVDDRLDLSGQKVRGFDLNGALFKAGLCAQQAEFCGLSWLQGARIDAELTLNHATFRFDLRLDEVVCPRLDMTGLRMEGVLRLDGAVVDELILTDAVLLANLSLARAKIGRIKADGLTVMGGLWSRGAAIDRQAFNDAHIEGRV